jgi:hypothetical protein
MGGGLGLCGGHCCYFAVENRKPENVQLQWTLTLAVLILVIFFPQFF